MRFTLSGKIFLAVTLVLVAFGAVSVFGIWRMALYQSQVTVLIKGLTPLTHEVREVLRSVDSLTFSLNQREPRQIAEARGFLLYMDPLRRVEQLVAHTEQRRRALPEDADAAVDAFLTTWQQDLERLNGGDSFYRTTAREAPAFLEVLDPLLSGDTSNRGVFTHVFTLLLEQVEREQRADGLPRDLVDKFLLATKRALFRAQTDLHRFTDDLSNRIEEQERSSLLALVVLSVVAFLFGVAVLVVTRVTLRPISRLTQAVRRLSSGDLDGHLEVRGSDEIATLAAEFNRLVQSLGERDRMLAHQRERLLRSERLAVIGKMASFIAHEVRNPLSSIGLNTEVLQEDAEARGAPDGEKKLLAAILQEVDRLKDVTEQYLQFARMPAAERIRFRVGELVDAFLTLQQPQLEREGITVTRDVEEWLQVSVDVGQLRQALMNLVANAVEALRDRPVKRLTIGARRAGEGWAELSVADTGAGIPDEVRERVTEPFFTTRRGGTGLGLAICQEIAEKHGGELIIDSTPGEGTRVTLRLPTRDDELPAEGEA
jgi:signal transduction histidine kinase